MYKGHLTMKKLINFYRSRLTHTNICFAFTIYAVITLSSLAIMMNDINSNDPVTKFLIGIITYGTPITNTCNACRILLGGNANFLDDLEELYNYVVWMTIPQLLFLGVCIFAVFRHYNLF